MSNLVNNNLSITGKVKDIKRMFDNATLSESGIYTLESFVPMPATFYEVDTTNSLVCFINESIAKYEKLNGTVDIETKNKLSDEFTKKYRDAIKYQMDNYGCVGWYDWRILNLGTKWDTNIISRNVLDTVMEHRDDESVTTIGLGFDTANLPPNEWLSRVCKANPNLEFDMWCNEESGYKFAYEGKDGVLSENLSGYFFIKHSQLAFGMDPDEVCELCNITDDCAVKAIHNKAIYKHCVQNAFEMGYWNKEGFVEEFEYYFESSDFKEELRGFVEEYIEDELLETNRDKHNTSCIGTNAEVVDLIREYLSDDDNIVAGIDNNDWADRFVEWAKSVRE